MAVRRRRHPDFAPLEYRLALDLAFSAIEQLGGHAPALLLVASDPAIVHEVCLRAAGSVTIVPDTDAALESAAGLVYAHGAQRPNVLRIAQMADPLTWERDAYDAAIWVSPRPATWRQLDGRLDAALVAGGTLAMLSPGLLSRPLAVGAMPGRTDATGWKVRHVPHGLSGRGYTLTYAYQLAGLKSVWWMAVSRAAALLGRPDLVDRAESGFRAAVADVRPGALSRLRLDVLTKGGHAWS